MVVSTFRRLPGIWLQPEAPVRTVLSAQATAGIVEVPIVAVGERVYCALKHPTTADAVA